MIVPNRFFAWRGILCAAAVLAWVWPARAENPSPLVIHSAFPGGSIRVGEIDQKERIIRFSPSEQHDRGWNCWWYFRVTGLTPGETVSLELTGILYARADQASFSLDNQHWTHTAPGVREGNRIRYRQQIDAKEAWFSWGPPFLLQQARELVQQAARRPHVTAFELCHSRDGYAVPALRVAQAGVSAAERRGIWVIARQHAWESGSSWVCRGFVEWLLSDEPQAEQLRKMATITIVPVMDVDNVQRGAGGKEAYPQDHNRDWSTDPFHPEVQAVIAQIREADQDGHFDLFVDLHNPSPTDRKIHFHVTSEIITAKRRQNQQAFLDLAKEELAGPIPFKGLVGGSAKNAGTSTNYLNLNTRDHAVALCLETGWNTPQSTQAGYLTTGRDVGKLIQRYFTLPRR